MSKRRPKTSMRPRWTVTWPNTCVCSPIDDAKVGREAELEVGVLARDPELARRIHAQVQAGRSRAAAPVRARPVCVQRVQLRRLRAVQRRVAVHQDDVRRGSSSDCRSLRLASGSSMRASSMSTSSRVSGGARVPAHPRRQRHDRQRLALRVDRKAIQLRVRRDVVAAGRPARFALPVTRALAGAARGRQLVEHHAVVVAVGAQVDVLVLAEAGQREHAVRPFEPARRARIGGACRARSPTPSAGPATVRSACVTPDRPAQVEPLRVQARVERRASDVQAARHRRIAEVGASCAAVACSVPPFVRGQPGVDLRLAVGVASPRSARSRPASCPGRRRSPGRGRATRGAPSVPSTVRSACRRPLSARCGSRSLSGGRPSRCITNGSEHRAHAGSARPRAAPAMQRAPPSGSPDARLERPAAAGAGGRHARARLDRMHGRSPARCARRWAGTARAVAPATSTAPRSLRAPTRVPVTESCADSVPPTRAG